MITIFKYAIDPDTQETIFMHEGAKVLSVQVQHGQVQIWALVNTSKPVIPRLFAIFGTGHEIPKALASRLAFVGTFQLDGGALVFHLFEAQ